MSDRHLVLSLRNIGDPAGTTAVLACQTHPTPYQVTRHTLVADLVTCPACQAVNAAQAALNTNGGLQWI